MNITVIGGAGYVGLITAACLAYSGHKVYCVDVDKDRIDRINSGVPIIYEKGLEQILEAAIKEKRLAATLDFESSVVDSSMVFICVGTPSIEGGDIDLTQVKDASERVGKALRRKKGYALIVVRSTVIPGTTERIVIPIVEKNSGRKAGPDFGVCMNPEFLREGSAVKDFLFPKGQGIVVGELDRKSGDELVDLYKDLDGQVFRTTIRTAEMVKYARNSYLAKDISFANEIANICQKLSIDFLDVKKGLEMDSRIGKGRFLNAGLGFGGSCFPKDVKALVAKAREAGIEPRILEATLKVNESQPDIMVGLVKNSLRELAGKSIAIFGLAFKPGTNDMREARSVPIIQRLLSEGATICAYDPQATEEARKIFENRIDYAVTADGALKNADAVIIVTEWPEFSNSKLYDSLRGNFVFDGRRSVNPEKLSGRFVYVAIGFPEGANLDR